MLWQVGTNIPGQFRKAKNRAYSPTKTRTKSKYQSLMNLGRYRIEKRGKFFKFCLSNSKYLTMGKEVLLRSQIGKDFFKHIEKHVPTIDAFLDYRIRVTELRKLGKYPDVWYQNEIEATDLILKVLSEN